jgi:hypothetical protein
MENDKEGFLQNKCKQGDGYCARFIKLFFIFSNYF